LTKKPVALVSEVLNVSDSMVQSSRQSNLEWSSILFLS